MTAVLASEARPVSPQPLGMGAGFGSVPLAPIAGPPPKGHKNELAT